MILPSSMKSCMLFLTLSESFQDTQVSSSTRPQSPLPMEGHHAKLSSSPPKSASVWPNLNSAHKKGTRS